MDLTKSSTRVPCPKGIRPSDRSLDIGPAPANLVLDSDHVSYNETYDELALNPENSGRAISDGEEDRSTTLKNHLIKFSNNSQHAQCKNIRSQRPAR